MTGALDPVLHELTRLTDAVRAHSPHRDPPADEVIAALRSEVTALRDEVIALRTTIALLRGTGVRV